MGLIFMQKRVIGILLVFVVMTLYIGQVRQFGYPGNLGLNINLINREDHKIKDASVSVYIYDLGIYKESSKFDLYRHERESKNIFIDTKGAEPGWYVARIKVTDNRGHSDTESRYVLVT